MRPGQKACSSLAHQVMIRAGQGQTLRHLQGASCSVDHQRDFVEARGWEQAGGAQQSAPLQLPAVPPSLRPLAISCHCSLIGDALPSNF